jgi:hypothetical protein
VGTSVAAEVDKVLGSDTIPDIPLSAVQLVIKKYARRGIRLAKRFGRIPELAGITGAALDERLKRKHGTTLAQEVAACCRQDSRRKVG